MTLGWIRERLLDRDVCEWCYVPITLFFLASLMIFFICSYQIAWVYAVERNVTLGEPFTVCEQPLGNRCRTEYMAVSSGGRSLFSPYLFEFGRHALHYGLEIEKAKYSFTYRLDGNEEVWSNLPRTGIAWIASLLGVIVWSLLAGPKHFGRFMRRGKD